MASKDLIRVEQSRASVEQERERAGRVRWSHVITLAALTALGPLGTDLYLPALPSLGNAFGASLAATQLTLTSYIFGLAFGQLLIGSISDARGRRGPLLIGLLLFMLVSLLCVVAPSIYSLNLLRFAQGLAGAAGIVLALAIARDLYEGDLLARTIGLLMGINALAPAIAPVLGGQLLLLLDWRGLFMCLGVFGLVLLVLAARVFPESLPKEARQSGGLSTSLKVFAGLSLNRAFMPFVWISAAGFATGITLISMTPFMLEGSFGLRPDQVSMVFGVNALALAALSNVSARLVGSLGARRLLRYGLVVHMLGALSLILGALVGLELWMLLLGMFLITASLGLIAPNTATLAMQVVDSQQAGSASALLGLLQLLVGALLAPVIGLAGSSSALPMACAIVACSLAAWLLLAFARR
jgi:DHA1 family bicyclomycin/chloramphenicol resistance-like MFS transporter